MIYWGIIREGWLLAGQDCETFLTAALSLSWEFCDGNVIEKITPLDLGSK